VEVVEMIDVLWQCGPGFELGWEAGKSAVGAATSSLCAFATFMLTRMGMGFI
jgi:hypothetical protein